MERREKRVTERDLVGHLLSFRDENGGILSEDQIADNIIGVLFAAQDTTASVLTWILKYLHDNLKLFEAVRVRNYTNISYSIIHLIGILKQNVVVF